MACRGSSSLDKERSTGKASSQQVQCPMSLVKSVQSAVVVHSSTRIHASPAVAAATRELAGLGSQALASQLAGKQSAGRVVLS